MDTYVMVALALLGFAFWQKKTWVFYASGIAWIILAIFAFKDNADNTIGWAYGWLYGALTLVCITAGLWLREKADDKDVKEEKKENEG